MKKLINLFFAGSLLFGAASIAQAGQVCVTGDGISAGPISLEVQATTQAWAQLCVEGTAYTDQGSDTLAVTGLVANSRVYVSGPTPDHSFTINNGDEAGYWYNFAVYFRSGNSAAATTWDITADANANETTTTSSRTYIVPQSAVSTLVDFTGANQLNSVAGGSVTLATGLAADTSHCGATYTAGCTNTNASLDQSQGIRVYSTDADGVTITSALDINATAI